MTTWIIGDIHGCFDTFHAWLQRAEFNADHDRLWFVGDLTNRGPKSLETLRWVYSHRDISVSVLGNHDLHLLCCDVGICEPQPRDTIYQVLEAEDREELMHWLRHQPLLHIDEHDILVHAGIKPDWDLETAKRRARTAEQLLQSDQYVDLLKSWRQKPRSEQSEFSEVHETLDVCTRMRTFYRSSKELCHEFSGTLKEMPGELIPWFKLRRTIPETYRIFFGHWAALGYHEEHASYALDSGCVWGRYLTGFRRSDEVVLAHPAIDRSLQRQYYYG